MFSIMRSTMHHLGKRFVEIPMPTGDRVETNMKAPLPTGPGMDRFNDAMDKILSVSHEEMQRLIAAHKKQSAQNPNKRGPKSKKS